LFCVNFLIRYGINIWEDLLDPAFTDVVYSDRYCKIRVILTESQKGVHWNALWDNMISATNIPPEYVKPIAELKKTCWANRLEWYVKIDVFGIDKARELYIPTLAQAVKAILSKPLPKTKQVEHSWWYVIRTAIGNYVKLYPKFYWGLLDLFVNPKAPRQPTKKEKMHRRKPYDRYH
jgi:hypothetical protein